MYKIQSLGNNYGMKNIVIVCLGTTKIVGDSLAPRVGQRLREQNVPVFVYGTQEKQINSLNYKEYYSFIERQHCNDIIIVVDATLGQPDMVGKIVLSKLGIKPGGAFEDKRNRIGDIGIMAIVGSSQGDRLANLNSVSEQTLQLLEKKTIELIQAIAV